MNPFKKIIIVTVFILSGVLMASPTSALSKVAELHVKISALRATHAELKAEVQAGTMSAEEARAQWQRLVSELREEKEALFAERMNTIREKYEQFAEKNPERADLVKQRIDASVQHREEIKAKRMEINSQVQTGEITRSDASVMKREFLNTARQEIQTVRSLINTQREARGYVEVEGIKGHANERSADGFIRIGDIKGELYNNLRVDPGQTGTAVELNANGSVNQMRFDPMGTNALRVFPQVKSDLEQATTNYNSVRTNEVN